MPTPTALTTAHLRHALVPAPPGDEPADPRPFLVHGIGRIDVAIDLADRWRDRFPTLPEPPRRQTLDELVQAARRRVREERVRVDREELEARRFVLERVLAGLEP